MSSHRKENNRQEEYNDSNKTCVSLEKFFHKNWKTLIRPVVYHIYDVFSSPISSYYVTLMLVVNS